MGASHKQYKGPVGGIAVSMGYRGRMGGYAPYAGLGVIMEATLTGLPDSRVRYCYAVLLDHKAVPVYELNAALRKIT